eukprot:4167042-Pyramimonas_sp.AAC.2
MFLITTTLLQARSCRPARRHSTWGRPGGPFGFLLGGFRARGGREDGHGLHPSGAVLRGHPRAVPLEPGDGDQGGQGHRVRHGGEPQAGSYRGGGALPPPAAGES